MNALPDLTSPKSIRNLALATLLPASAGYAFARYLQGRMTDEEAAEFEKQVEEFTKAENPVISLDPHTNDLKEEKELEAIGLKKKAAAVPGAAVRSAWQAVGDFVTKHPKTSVGIGVGTSAAAHGLWGLGQFRKNRKSAFTGTMEPGLLLAAAYIAGLAGMAAGRRADSKEELEKLEKERPRVLNELEKAEYDRLFQLNDPEGYAKYILEEEKKRKKQQKAAEKVADSTVPKVSYTEADMLHSMVMLNKQATSIPAPAGAGVAKALTRPFFDFSPTSKRVLGAAGVLGGTYAGYKALGFGGSGLNLIKQAYPLIFAILLMGGMAAGKHIGDSGDLTRIRKKALKKYLTQDMLDTQSPTILEAGSDLPWEKARAGGAELALSDEDLPEETKKRAIREQQEIRI
jgi:hypothetical protein